MTLPERPEPHAAAPRATHRGLRKYGTHPVTPASLRRSAWTALACFALGVSGLCCRAQHRDDLDGGSLGTRVACRLCRSCRRRGRRRLHSAQRRQRTSKRDDAGSRRMLRAGVRARAVRGSARVHQRTRKYASLEDLPFRANWRRRIRSVQVGPAASVTMWADEGWRGASETLSAGSREPVLSKALSGRVQSLEIGCDC